MSGLRLIVVNLILISSAYASVFMNCIKDAGYKFGINPDLLYAIAIVESNLNPKAVNINKNGTRDYGIFQINESNLRRLKISKNKAFNPCYSAYIASYILRQCVNIYGKTWKAIDCYNKGKKAKGNSLYVKKIKKVLRKLGY